MLADDLDRLGQAMPALYQLPLGGTAVGTGITAERDLPLEWGPERNVRWRVPLPERGNSTAIVPWRKCWLPCRCTG